MAGGIGISVADLRPGDLVRLKKAHPCGGDVWRVNRSGADVGLRCQTCAHYIMTPRFRLERRIREVIRPSADPDADAGVAAGATPARAASDTDTVTGAAGLPTS